MTRLTFDIVVVGAGPAGLAAARSAAERGLPVALIDDNPATGGQIWRGGLPQAKTPQARHWLSVDGITNIQLLAGTRVVAAPRPGSLLAETSQGSALDMQYDRLILASGARELFLPFPGSTLPGVMGAGGLQALVKGGLSITGKRVVVAGSGPLVLAVAAYLKKAGAQVLAIAEQARRHDLLAFGGAVAQDPARLTQATQLAWELRGTPYFTSCWPISAQGDDRLISVTLHRHAKQWTIPCDYLACGFGLRPNLELPIACGCRIGETGVWVDTWQQTTSPGIFCAGEVTGIGGLELSLCEGQIAGYAATGNRDAARHYVAERHRQRRFAGAMSQRFALRSELKTLPQADTIVCRCEDVTYGDLISHTGWRSAKLQTRCGMGPCQGRICGGATTFLFGWGAESVRPPVSAARLGTLAQLDEQITRSQEGI